jgi:hypothetical protein
VSIWYTDPKAAAMNGQYKKPTVFEIVYESSHQVRQGDVDDDRVVGYERKPTTIHILAQSEEMARAAWTFDHRYPHETPEHIPVILSIRPLCTIDMFCAVTRWRAF